MWLHKLFLSTSGEPSLLEELWAYLEGKYFSVETGGYENIHMGSGTLITLQRVVLGIFIGVIIAAGFVCYDKNRLGAFVRQLVKDSGYPNMKVVQFAFEPADIGGANDYWPHNYGTNHWVYTGTHDNDTLAGWFAGLDAEGKKQVREYLNDYTTPDAVVYKSVIALAMRSTADTCVIPIQDHLGLDSTCRMNAPGTVGVNWRWRLIPGQVTAEAGKDLLGMSKRFARANWDALNAKEAEAEK